MKANPVKVGGYDILKVVRTGKCFNAYEIMLVRWTKITSLRSEDLMNHVKQS